MSKLIVLIALAAGGCASAADIYRAGVDETAVIEKPLAEVTQCMALRMSASPITDADGKTTFFVNNPYGDPLGLISLSAVPEGTLVEVRRRNGLVATGMWKGCR